MIELSAQQKLALLFEKSNKAIAQTIQDASPQQLQKLNEAKDLPSVITELMNDTLDASKSNKIILDILKNSAFFKELGSFSQDLKVLIELLNGADPQGKLDKIAKALQSVLIDLSKHEAYDLKEFIKNSGLFLESKLSHEINPKQELKRSLEELLNKLHQSELPSVKKLAKEIGRFVHKSDVFSNATDISSLSHIKSEVERLLSELKDILKTADPIHSKSVKQLVTALEELIQGKKSVHFSLSALNNLIDEISSELRLSTQGGTKQLLSELESIANKINAIQKNDQTQALLKSALTRLEGIDTNNLSNTQLKELNANSEKLKLMAQMKLQDLQAINQEQFKTFFTNLSHDLIPEKANGLFDIIEKILGSLKQTHTSFEQEKIPQGIKSWLNSFDKEVNKGDVIHSKHMQTLLDKVELFVKPAHLLNNNLLQENLQKDMKALLLGLENELTGSTTNTEILKTVDKLLIHIDYFQLLSHLSNSSCLYIPYAWEQLENGSLSFKKSKDGSSYCEIDLELSEYGKVNMMLQLFEDNQLNIMIYTQKRELKALFKENMKSLRSALVGVNIMPRNIHLHDLDEAAKKSHPYEGKAGLNKLGFEAKG